jgi:hypothetical protein
MTTEEIQSLLTDANCLRCYTNASLSELIRLALLGQINSNLSGGQVMHGDGPPVAPPPNQNAAAIYYDDNSANASYGIIWPWDTNLHVWIGA